MVSDFYTYRKEIEIKRSRKRWLVIALAILLILSAAAGAFWFWKGESVPAASVESTEEEAKAEATPTPDPTPTPEPAAQATAETAGYAPHRLLPEVDNAAWDKSEKVEATLNQDYQNTDHRMVALPMLGTVTDDYFNTVTFVGDSLTSGLGIYATGYQNAHYAAYKNIGPDVIVNNGTVTNAVTGATETPIETIVASQPDYVYLLFGTNTMVQPNNEEKLLAYYERMIDILRENLNPGVIFYIQAIPGVQEDVVLQRPGLDNARIAAVNDQIANLALRKGCYFVNIREALTKPDGSLIDEYDANYDGVHFNPEGYQAWSDYLATHTAWNRRSIYLGENPYYIYGT